MVFGNIFAKKKFDATIFEQELDFLSEQINDSRSRTLTLEVNSKVLKRRIVKYSVEFYLVVIAYLLYVTPSKPERVSYVKNFWFSQSPIKFSIIFGYPLLIFIITHLIGRFFAALQRRQKIRYITLKKEKEAKIEQLKKETNFNSTNDILTKYGEKKAEVKKQEKKKPQEKQLQQQKQQQQGAQQFPQHSQNIQLNQPGRPGLQQGPGLGIQQVSSLPPAARTFQDRLLDVIIGSDNNESVENRFALICANCFAHNGLAPPGCTHPKKVQYICPKCGFCNGFVEEKVNEEPWVEPKPEKINEKSDGDKEEIDEGEKSVETK